MSRIWKASISPWEAVSRAYDSFDEHDGTLLAGGIAFFAMLSVAPVLVLAMGLASVLLGDEAVSGVLESELEPILGAEPAKFLTELVKRAGEPAVGSVAALVATLFMVYAATRVFVELQTALYRVWGIQPKAFDRFSMKAWRFFYNRGLAFLLVMVLGLLLSALMLAEAALQALAQRLGLASFTYLLRLGDLTLGYLALTALIGSIYRLLAGGMLTWRAALRGAAATGLLLAFGGVAIGLYLRLGFSYTVYGAAGSFAALMLAAYYAATIFLFGAELAQVYRAAG